MCVDSYTWQVRVIVEFYRMVGVCVTLFNSSLCIFLSFLAICLNTNVLWACYKSWPGYIPFYWRPETSLLVGGASAAVLKFSVTANIFFFFHGILTKYSICTPYLEGFLYTKSKKGELNKGLQHCWGIFLTRQALKICFVGNTKEILTYLWEEKLDKLEHSW